VDVSTRKEPGAASPPSGAPAAGDTHDLAGFGYRAELDRTLGGFSSFAAGFSYLSILTGIFQMFYVGFGAGGPAFFWTWPVVFVGQFLVALCFAELAAHYPLAGGVYQWSKHVGSGALGWLTGWIYVANLIITISAVALALQITLPQISDTFKLLDNQEANAVLLGCILIAFTTVINCVGIGLLARINNLGVLAELLGAGLLIVLLAVHTCRGPDVLFDTQGHGAGLAYAGPFLAAALMASYVMYGFDTAGSLAEETTDPRRKAPRAILRALSAAAFAGALLLLFALTAACDLNNPKLGDGEDGGLPWLVRGVLGDGVGKVFLCDVIFAVTVCTLAVQSGAVRMMFAMARDNNLPFGHALSRVSETSRTPVVPAVVAGLLAAAILLVNVWLPGAVDLVAPIAILWANLAYLLVTLPLLVRRMRGWPGDAGPDGRRAFALGRWGVPVNLAAVVWGVGMILNIGWPRRPTPETTWYQQYGAVLFTAGLVAAGGLYYVLVQRHKTGVLEEHRARRR
jgi:urea carboxylase system permease